MKAYLKFSLLIAAIVVASAAYFFIAGPKTEDVEIKSHSAHPGWSTYKSEDGFSLEYPAGYRVLSLEKSPHGFTINPTGKVSEYDSVVTYQSLLGFLGGKDKGKFQNPDEWLAEQQRLGNNYRVSTKEGVTVYESNDGSGSYMWFTKGNDGYDLHWIEATTYPGKVADPLSQQIIQSIVFE